MEGQFSSVNESLKCVQELFSKYFKNSFLVNNISENNFAISISIMKITFRKKHVGSNFGDIFTLKFVMYVDFNVICFFWHSFKS